MQVSFGVRCHTFEVQSICSIIHVARRFKTTRPISMVAADFDSEWTQLEEAQYVRSDNMEMIKYSI